MNDQAVELTGVMPSLRLGIIVMAKGLLKMAGKRHLGLTPSGDPVCMLVKVCF